MLILTIQMLHDMERQICAVSEEQEPDFEDIYHTSTDEQLEAMAEEFARTHHAQNTTPLWLS